MLTFAFGNKPEPLTSPPCLLCAQAVVQLDLLAEAADLELAHVKYYLIHPAEGSDFYVVPYMAVLYQ